MISIANLFTPGASRLSSCARGLVFLVVLIIGCQGDRALTGGYQLIWMNGCEVRIFRKRAAIPNEMIAGSIQSYAVNGPYITGYADTRCIDSTAEPDAHPGYFFVDTRTDDLRQGMSEIDWKRELKTIGWNSPRLAILRRTKE